MVGFGWPGGSGLPGPTPVLELASGNCIAFAGRIDNRRDLLDTLELPEDYDDAAYDAAVVLAGYRAWGTATAARLLGDFAFALWDQAASRLYCARDYSGVKPLYYARQGGRFVFASEIGRVINGLDRVPPPNEGMVAERLIGIHENRHETLYEGVFRLPPGHQLTVAGGGERLERFWDLQPRAPIRYRREEDYCQHFLEIFRRAVMARMPSSGELGAMLSGGLDSSSVVGVAAGILLDAGRVRSLSTYSIVFPGLSLDESPYIEAVVGTWGMRSFRFPWSGIDCAPDWLAQARAARDIPDYPTLGMTAPLMQQAAGNGVRAILTGEGGDFWLTGTRYPYPDLLASGGLIRAGKELAHQFGRHGPRYALTSLLRSLLWPTVPVRLRARIERTRSRGDWTGFLNPDLVQRVRLRDRLHCNDCSSGFSRLYQWELYRSAMAGRVSHYLEIADRSDAGYGIQRVHPLMDRRIAEFAMAIPDYVHHARGRGKSLLRDAKPAILPPTVASRLDRGDFSVVYARAIGTPQVIAVLESPGAPIREWIAPQALAAGLRLARAGSTIEANLHRSGIRRAWMSFAVDTWQRGVYGP